MCSRRPVQTLLDEELVVRLSGKGKKLEVVMDDGSEMEYGPDDALVIPPGHDAWIVGDEPCVVLDFAGADEYAKGARS